MKEKEAKVSAARALYRLWAEFTDPGPAGDTLNMLKKYADGLVPGCMGLVFMGAGILVMTLFSFQMSLSDMKTFLPLLFGGVFALAGFVVARLGVSSILKKAGGRSADDRGQGADSRSK